MVILRRAMQKEGKLCRVKRYIDTAKSNEVKKVYIDDEFIIRILTHCMFVG